MIAKTRTRAKLTRDGVDFLTSTSFPLSVAPAHPCPDYARTVNSYPHKPEKEAVLASLHAIPGNESYTLQSLAAWFARHRNPSGASSAHVAGAPVLLNDETIRASPRAHPAPRSPRFSLSQAHPRPPPAAPGAVQERHHPLRWHHLILGRAHRRRTRRD
jgi:hypothetical protein